MKKLNVKWETPKPKKADPSPYNSWKWKKFSRQFRIKNNKCADCGAVHYDYKELDVDHIKPLSEGGAMYDLNNLQSLCHSCHSKKTNEAKRGKG